MLDRCGCDVDIRQLFLSEDINWKPDLPKWGFGCEPRKYIDEWGCIWTVLNEDDMGQVTGHPLSDLKDIKNYVPPDPNADGRFREVFEKREDDKYNLLWMPLTLFERLYMLHGFNKTLIDMIEKKKEIEELLDIILNFNLKVIERISKERILVDGVSITDDWGTNTSLFISPDLWRKIFKKRYEKIIKTCHNNNLNIWMHSDGRVNDIMDDFVEIGLDAINLACPKVVGIEEIGGKYNGKINFFTAIDTQKTIIFGSEKEIREEFEKVADNWGSRKGGLIIFLDDYNYGTLRISEKRKEMICKTLMSYINYYK